MFCDSPRRRIGARVPPFFPLRDSRFVLQRPTFQRGDVRGLAGRSVARVDLSILQEIVRVVQARARVPARVSILKRQYQLTYLDDHRQRIEEALRRHDGDRLNMLFGQLASKVKYQLLRRAPSATQRKARARVAPRSSTRRGQRKRARSR